MKHKKKHFDIIVVGGGHAGIEAAHISAFKGHSVCLVTMDKKAIGRMSCNPSVGGLAKGQMVREIDILGGLMGRLADVSGLQYKMLNTSKGRSVWSPRAQVDKRNYETLVTKFLFSIPSLDIIEKEVINILVKNDQKEVPIISRERQLLKIKSCLKHLKSFNVEKNTDMAADDIRSAIKEVEEIYHKFDIEQILDIIFNDFCIGK